MDDLDRTFLKLKRTGFTDLQQILRLASGGRIYVVMDTNYELKLRGQYHQLCRDHGWSIEDFNAELERTRHD